MSKTPLTDVFEKSVYESCEHHDGFGDWGKFARGLENMLSDAKERLIDATIIKHFRCAYCGDMFDPPATYVQGVPITQNDILSATKAHMGKCQSHPIRKYERLIDPAKRALAVVSQFLKCIENPNGYFMELTGKPEPVAQLTDIYDALKKALEPFEESENTEHRCLSCAHEFATCAAKRVVWGIDRDPSARGADADKVLECDQYKQKPGCGHMGVSQ